jgi:hypothetical protein
VPDFSADSRHKSCDLVVNDRLLDTAAAQDHRLPGGRQFEMALGLVRGALEHAAGNTLDKSATAAHREWDDVLRRRTHITASEPKFRAMGETL